MKLHEGFALHAVVNAKKARSLAATSENIALLGESQSFWSVSYFVCWEIFGLFTEFHTENLLDEFVECLFNKCV